LFIFGANKKRRPVSINAIKEKIITYFKTRSKLQQVLIVTSLLTGFIFIALFVLVVLIWSGALGRLPGKEELRAINNPVATEIFSADSVLLGRYYIQERSNITFDKIPKHVIHAVIATEDVRFYKHHGIDYRSLMRVLFKSILLQKESSGGGSTLTQQLAKNLFPRKQYPFLSLPINKIREIIIASRIENLYDKDAIITLYLNTIPFGDNTFGIEAASQRFFSIPAQLLTIENGAVLVGMLKASYAYNPRIFTERSTLRRNVVLSQMHKYNMLSKQRMDSLHILPIKLAYNKITHHTGLAPYFREYIRPELETWCNNHNNENGKPYNLYTDGLKIYTTINARLQQYAEQATDVQMAVIQKKFNNHWGRTMPWKSNPQIVAEAVKRSDRYKNLKQEGLSEEKINSIMNTPVLMSIFTWEGEKEVQMSPLDSIKHYLSFLNAGVLAMDPQHGSIMAWVGGINHHYFQYDHIKESTKRQVGSTFKPIVYAAALERGADPCDYISAEQTVYSDMDGWRPQNTHDDYDMKFSMEGALAYSVNTVSVKVLEKAGISNTIALAKKMGIASDLPPYPSLALGTADVSMLEMVTAYSCFVNNGIPVKPFYIKAITTHEGVVVEKFTSAKSEARVLSQETAQLMIQMLKRTVNEGTGLALRSRYKILNDVAGKTGTTQSNADGWFIAMSPKMVIGAWVGSDDRRIRFRSTALGQGASTALPIVGSVFQQINKDQKFNKITLAKFPSLPSSVADKLSCDLYKSDETFFEKIFGKRDRESNQEFGAKKKKGFFRRLFSNR
jgi:penicillin-binding protein 1A